MSQFSFRLEPNHTVEADRTATSVQPGLASPNGHSVDILVGTGSMVENLTATHGQITNACGEPMVDYAYSQHGPSSVPGVSFHPWPFPSVPTASGTQWHSHPTIFEHRSQPAPGPSIGNSLTQNNYPQEYPGASGATGTPQEQQHHGSAWVTMPGGFQFAIPVVVATVLMISGQHHCGSCGSQARLV